jgi:hypothetical protein
MINNLLEVFMIKRENEFGVKCLVMCPTFSIIDPATQARLYIKSTVDFYPDDFLPEFVDAQNSIRQELEKQTMTVDAATGALVSFFNQYEPIALKVKVEVINNNIFFPVTVYIENGTVPGEGGGEGEGGSGD